MSAWEEAGARARDVVKAGDRITYDACGGRRRSFKMRAIAVGSLFGVRGTCCSALTVTHVNGEPVDFNKEPQG